MLFRTFSELLSRILSAMFGAFGKFSDIFYRSFCIVFGSADARASLDLPRAAAVEPGTAAVQTFAEARSDSASQGSVDRPFFKVRFDPHRATAGSRSLLL